MINIEAKYRYSRNIKLSIIASLVISIVAFLYFPDYNRQGEKILFTDINISSFENIPVTIQSNPSSSFSKPNIPPIIYSQQITWFDMLNDVVINFPDNTSTANIFHSKISGSNKTSNEKIEQLPFKPRQIFEVVPPKNEDVNGVISLSLKIDTLGNVINCIILKNTIENESCINSVISAASKSRWQPAEIDGKKVEYWVEKSYTFN